MTTGRIGVAISTTGDEHRMGFLETCVHQWNRALPEGSALFVTVDGTEDDQRRVNYTLRNWMPGAVWRVGQPDIIQRTRVSRDGRMGVATNKNTGLELLMGALGEQHYPDVQHLFLCDDDTWPKNGNALRLHTHSDLPHSMVAWGKGRWVRDTPGYTEWSWPRGVLLYTHRSVVVEMGGMDERFGPGGHEHAEWSRRIHQKGLTPAPFCSPPQYAEDVVGVGWSMGAFNYWNAEDMPRQGESSIDHGNRKRKQGTVRRGKGDWTRINRLMEEHDGNPGFVPFRAASNGRLSATLCSA